MHDFSEIYPCFLMDYTLVSRAKRSPFSWACDWYFDPPAQSRAVTFPLKRVDRPTSEGVSGVRNSCLAGVSKCAQQTNRINACPTDFFEKPTMEGIIVLPNPYRSLR